MISKNAIAAGKEDVKNFVKSFFFGNTVTKKER